VTIIKKTVKLLPNRYYKKNNGGVISNALLPWKYPTKKHFRYLVNLLLINQIIKVKIAHVIVFRKRIKVNHYVEATYIDRKILKLKILL